MLLPLLGFGIFLKKRGPLHFDKKTIKKGGGKYESNEIGKNIEYLFLGINLKNVPVVATIDGSGPYSPLQPSKGV